MNPFYKTNSPHRFQNAPYMNNITEVKLHVEYIICGVENKCVLMRQG